MKLDFLIPETATVDNLGHRRLKNIYHFYNEYITKIPFSSLYFMDESLYVNLKPSKIKDSTSMFRKSDHQNHFNH